MPGTPPTPLPAASCRRLWEQRPLRKTLPALRYLFNVDHVDRFILQRFAHG